MNMIYRPITLSTALQQAFGDAWLGFSKERDGFFSPNVDISEEEDAMLLQVEIPGVSKDEISVDLKEGTLTISGEKKMQGEEENTHSERFFGRFKRSFNMGKIIDPDNIEATYANGVLNLRLGKLPEAQPKHIEIAVKEA